MSIREHLKKIVDQSEERLLVQVRIENDLMELVDAQIKRDRKDGIDIDRTILFRTACLNYLNESSDEKKRRSS